MSDRPHNLDKSRDWESRGKRDESPGDPDAPRGRNLNISSVSSSFIDYSSKKLNEPQSALSGRPARESSDRHTITDYTELYSASKAYMRRRYSSVNVPIHHISLRQGLRSFF